VAQSLLGGGLDVSGEFGESFFKAGGLGEGGDGGVHGDGSYVVVRVGKVAGIVREGKG
jgi:hypothetical protein